MKIPILTYHSLNTRGTEYHTNDHEALPVDLALLKRLGYTLCPLSVIVRLYLRGKLYRLSPHKVCALSFDDGVTHDYIDFQHPHRGLMKSFATILQEASANRPGWRRPRATCFVIASPQARDVLDKTCIAGRDQWHDRWWLQAAESRIFEFGNHSWDHNHNNLQTVAQRNQQKGDFYVIDNQQDADAQVLQAERYLSAQLGGYNQRLFAYPYGHVSRFLRDEYFPRNSAYYRAAFTIDGDFMTEASHRWALPRFVCGEHWQAPEELERLVSQPHRRGTLLHRGRKTLTRLRHRLMH